VKLRGFPRLLLDAGKDFGKDDVLTQSAALALYTAGSLAPLIVVLMFFTQMLGEDAKKAFLAQASGMVGPLGGEAIASIADTAGRDFESHRTPVAIALGIALFSTTAVFGQLQAALNHVWNVKPVPGWNLWGWVKKRLLTFGLLAVVGFLLVVSLGVSAGLAMLFTQEGWMWRLAELAVSIMVFTVLFAAVFRILPDVTIAWRETWIGAAITAVLFAGGKYAIGTYLGMSSIGRAYGSMGSLLALVLWVYWSAVIVLYGAEVTQVYAKKHRAVRPRGPAKRKAKPRRRLASV
jgi:membrane protein